MVVPMQHVTTYQSMCSDVLCEGQAIASPSHTGRTCIHSRKQCSKEPIPFYFAWNRLDPSYKDDEEYDQREARPPPQCRLDENEVERPKATTIAAAAPSSHHFLVAPDLIDENEPFVTEYADKYRAWTIPVKKATSKKGKRQDRNGRRQEDGRGVELALQGLGITPPKTKRKQKKPPSVSSICSTGSSRRPPAAGKDVRTSSPVSLVDAPVLITCDHRPSDGTAKTSEFDNQSHLTGSTAPSTPTSGAFHSHAGNVPPPPPPPSCTPEKSGLAAKDGDIWFIASGNTIKDQKLKQHGKTTSKARIDNNKLREARRDMPFWKSSSSSLLGIPTTPNHSVSKGRARRFGEKNDGGRGRLARASTAPSTCPSPQKLSKMLLTSRRGLSSTKLFPRLPNDPFRKDAFKRKV